MSDDIQYFLNVAVFVHDVSNQQAECRYILNIRIKAVNIPVIIPRARLASSIVL